MSGTAPVARIPEGGAPDLVITDDFLYGERQPE
jgi:hypothetical protein